MRFLLPLALVLSGLVTTTASAQTGRAAWESYSDRIATSRKVAALGDNLFGDQVSLSNGALSFAVTDVALPGAGPAIALGRSYTVRDMRRRGAKGFFGDWEANIPSISAIHMGDWIDSEGGVARCSVGGAPLVTVTGMEPSDFWQGNQIDIPGVTSGELMWVRPTPIVNSVAKPVPMPTTGGPYHYLTNDQVRVSCLTTIKNGTGEGFLAVTPDGTKYWFDWLEQRQEPWLKVYDAMLHQGGPAVFTYRAIYDNRLLVTKVQDRFGNTVTYSYSGTTVKITSGIDASGTGGDGRQIVATFGSNSEIASVSDGTRTWTYEYQTTPNNRPSLSRVVQPDGSAWLVQFAQFTDAELPYRDDYPFDEPLRGCFFDEYFPEEATIRPVGTITHPSGAVGTFTTFITTHGRSHVPLTCRNVTIQQGHPNNTNDDIAVIPLKYKAFTLASKQITGPGLTPALWTYSYASMINFVLRDGGQGQTKMSYPVCTMRSPDGGLDWNACVAPVCTSETCAGWATTTVAGPDNQWVRYRYGNTYEYNEGKLLRVDVGSGSAPATTTLPQDIPSNALRTTVYTYDYSGSDTGAYLAYWGTGLRMFGDSWATAYHRPLLSTMTTQQGVEFLSEQQTFDEFARPLRVRRWSRTASNDAVLQSRTDDTAWYDHKGLWVLGQVASVTHTDSAPDFLLESTDYDATTALPVAIHAPRNVGQAALDPQLLTHTANGNLATVTDGNGRTTTLSDWYRGVPRRIDYPDITAHIAVVNALGWITSVTDQAGFTTGYGYDAMGRINLVTPPTGDSVAWNPTTIAFAKTTTTTGNYGFPIGTWQQTVSTGNGRAVTWYDALWRPLMSREYDTANATGTQRFNAWSYDASGRPVFAAYPLATATTLASFTQGTDTGYDALGRPLVVSQDNGSAAALVSTTEYLTGFQTRVTSPRDYADAANSYPTTTIYFAWDQPDMSMPRLISAPEGATTTITRDTLGRTLIVNRAGPWNGSTLSVNRDYRYDPYGRLERRVSPEERTTYFDYDDVGNLTASYQCNSSVDLDCGWTVGGGRPSDVTTRTYDAMNRVTFVDYPSGTTDVTTTYTTDGLPATVAAGSVLQTYTYNKRRLLVSERLSGFSSIDWLTQYGYDANGAAATLTYPDGHQVSFAPNALGQPTQAGTYATGVQYFPNGAVKQFSYGNGIAHVMVQNERGLPETSLDEGAVTVIDDTYLFDANGNVTQIVDGQPGAPGTRTMSYDQLDRLIGVAAGSAQGGNAVFAYDPLDNIRRLDQGARAIRHVYATGNRLTSVTDAAGTPLYAMTHDIRGNQITRTGTHADTYTFDKANRLTGTTVHNSLGTPVASTYLYDGLGRRVREITGDATFSGYSQAGQLLYQDDRKPAVDEKHDYIYLAGSLVAKRTVPATGPTVVTYQHTDALGSPIATTNQSGSLIGFERMTAYGEPADTSMQRGPGFTGHVMDQSTSLVYMQQRYYDPLVGRFISADPYLTSTEDGSLFSRYVYALNNPVRNVDPDGRRSTEAERLAANQATGEAAEATVRRALQDAGIEFTEQIALTLTAADGTTVEAVADFAYREGDTIHFIEVKGGMGSKLSGGQKAVYAAISAGRVTITSPHAMRFFNLTRGETLAKAAVHLRAIENSRAWRQFGRLFAPGLRRALVVAASTPVMAIDLITMTNPYDPMAAMRDTTPRTEYKYTPESAED